MSFQDDTVRRIMLLSHEIGREISISDVQQKAGCILEYLEKEGIEGVDLEYALLYWLEFLEERHYG